MTTTSSIAELIKQSAQSGPTSSEDSLAKVFEIRLASPNADKELESVQPDAYVSSLQRGVSGQVLRALMRQIPKRIVCRALGTDESNISKLVRRQRLSWAQTETLDDLVSAWRELNDFFENDTELLQEWLSAPIAALGESRPEDLIISQRGRKILRHTLDEMRYGDFA